jgi:hypothetical protein
MSKRCVDTLGLQDAALLSSRFRFFNHGTLGSELIASICSGWSTCVQMLSVKLISSRYKIKHDLKNDA